MDEARLSFAVAACQRPKVMTRPELVAHATQSGERRLRGSRSTLESAGSHTTRTSCARVGRTRSHGHPARATCRSSRSAYLVTTSGLTRWTAQPGQPGRANQLSRHGQRLRSGARLWGRAALPRLDAEPEQPILGLDE